VGLFAASGVAHVLAVFAGGRGSYEATLGAFGIAMTLPWFITWKRVGDPLRRGFLLAWVARRA
jgi:hypothetical protein